MSSRIQSSKQGRELRNSRERLPSARSGLYDLFQARMDTRRERVVISNDSGPKYRERPSIDHHSPAPIPESVPIPMPVNVPAPAPAPVLHVASYSTSELLKINQELKYQSEQHRTEIEHLKALIEQVRHPVPTTDLKDQKQNEEQLSKQTLFQQEMGYTIQEIAHKLQILENNIHHIEEMRDKDSGDPVIVQHKEDLNFITNEDIVKIIDPIRLGLEQIEEDVLKEDDILDIIAGAIDPLQKNNEMLKHELFSRMDVIQKLVNTFSVTAPVTGTSGSSLEKEEVIEIVRSILTPIIKDIQQNAKDIDSTKSLIDEKIGIFDKQIKSILESSLKTVESQINSGVDKSITLIESRINKLADSIKSIPAQTVNKKDIEIIEDTIKKLKEEIQSSRQSARNESAEREREITKEQKRIMDKVLELEKKITGKELLKKPSSRDLLPSLPSLPVKEEPVAEKEVLKNEVIYMTDDETKKRLAEIEEKLEAIQNKPVASTPARSVTPIQRRSQSREKELDGHRLRDVPVFSAELRETMVVKGDVGPMPLINDTLWNIIADTTAGFDYGGGYYECPVTGAYMVNLICKTLSTSVTLKITLVHIDSDGHILKAYSLDQSNMINEHSMTLRLPHAEKRDRLKFLVESRFNIALKGHEEIEVRGEKYPIVSTLVQIAYIPPVGFCET